MSLYKKTEKFVQESFLKTSRKKSKHSERTVFWLKKIYPQADEAMLIAAIAHDVERAFKENILDGIENRKKGFLDRKEMKRHQEKGAEIIAEFLAQQNADKKIIEKVKLLVSKHEFGGDEEQNILKLIDLYVQAVNTADADLLESLFWKDDPRFTEVENHIPTPFGAKTFSDMSDWIRKNGKPGNNQQFYETAVHILSPRVAYSVSMRNEYQNSTTSSSRVTLLYLKKGDQWKIIHYLG